MLYDRVIVLILLSILIWVSGYAIYKVSSLPTVNEVFPTEVVVEDIQCSNSNAKSSLLIKINIGAESEFKLIKTIKNCSEDSYRYLIGKKVTALISRSSNLSVWGLQYENKELMNFEQVRSAVIKESVVTLFIGWSIFGIVYAVRRKRSAASRP